MDLNPIRCQGWLYKKSKTIKTFRKRWVVLNTKYLIAFKEERRYENKTEIFDLSVYDTIRKTKDNEVKLELESTALKTKRVFQTCNDDISWYTEIREVQKKYKLVTDNIDFWINNLLKSHLDLLIQADTQPMFQKYKKDIFYCWINFGGFIGDTSDWGCSFNLFLLKGYKYTLNANFKQIKQLHTIAYNKRDKYFITEPLPNLGNRNKRSKQLIEAMDTMRRYTILNKKIQLREYICKGPRWSGNTQPDKNDTDTLCFILNQLFNSPLFVLEDYLYQVLSIDDNMKRIIQTLAITYLENLKKTMCLTLISTKKKSKKNKRYKRTNKENIEDYEYIHQEIQTRNITFDTVIAVAIPPEANISMVVPHWCIIFEAPQCSMQLDYFEDSKVHIQIINNYYEDNEVDIKGQRICWYSWFKQTEFIKRYVVLSPLNIDRNPVTGNDISDIIKKWLDVTYQLYHGYNAVYNNCQHFVRDIVSIFCAQQAKKLTDKFDKIKYEAMLSPALPSADLTDEYKRVKKMHDILSTQLLQSRRKREKKSILLKQILNNVKLDHGKKYHKKLINAGFCDSNYYTIEKRDLRILGIDENEQQIIIDEINNTPNAMLDFFVSSNLKKYYEEFYSNGFDHRNDIYLFKFVTEHELNDHPFKMKLGPTKRFMLGVGKINYASYSSRYSQFNYRKIIVSYFLEQIKKRDSYTFKSQIEKECSKYYFDLFLFLKEYKLETYYEKIKDELVEDDGSIDFEILQTINQQNLEEKIKMKCGHAKRFLYGLKIELMGANS
eukprot:450912_1